MSEPTYGTTSTRGFGGRFGPNMPMGGEGFNIMVSIGSDFDNAGFVSLFNTMKDLQTINQGTADSTAKVGLSGKETAENIREQIAPIRSVSWDLILMGRSMSILNTTFFGSNQILKELTGAIYGVGAAMRIIVTIADLYRVATQLGIVTTTAATVAEGSRTAGLFGLAGAMATVKAVLGDPTGLALLGIGIAATAAAVGLIYASTIRSYQHGGTIPSTGPYLLHKGETVIPAGTSTNIININMYSGGISSNVDVDRMLDAMALKMSQESRRRMGR